MPELHSYAINYILSDDLESFRDLFLLYCGKPEKYCRTTVLSIVSQQGGPMYFLLEGMIKVYTTNPSGYIRILGYHRQNTLFAMDRILPGEGSVVNTEAVTNVTILPVTWDSLNLIAEKEPQFMKTLLKYYGKVLRLMCYDAEVKSIDDVGIRMASFLCLITRENKGNEMLCIDLTQEELASAVNASRVQISRILSKFRKNGLIKTYRGGIELLNREELSRMANERKQEAN